MTAEKDEKIPWRERFSKKFQLTPRQKDRWRTGLQVLGSILGGGLMMCFLNFTVLIQLTGGITVFLLAILIGILVGMVSPEIHYAVLSGITTIFMGLIMFSAIVVGPLQMLVTPQLGNVFIVVALYSTIYTIHFQIFGILFGSFIGSVIGPEWY
ncbi:MAG: hypothetical protein ACFFDP_05650 [Promethearchaeota archaeon]